MIWFFERRGERLQCEIRRAAIGRDCELVWTASDGRMHVERADDPSELVHRRRALEHWLKLDGWVRLGRITPPSPVRTPVPPRRRPSVDEVTASEQTPLQHIVVRRGQVATFELLARTFAHHPGIQIIWDRRQHERRRAARPTGDNRRRQERRRQPPDQWTHLNYLVVPADSPAI
jgi:hypothetical protein